MKLTERTDKTGDGSCTVYPNADHKSFSACVDHENKLWIMPDLGTNRSYVNHFDVDIENKLFMKRDNS